MIGSLLTFFAIGLVTLVAAGVALSLIGIVFSVVFGVGAFLLFKVAPILLVGWLVLKLIDRARGGSRRISAADRRWLDQG